MGSMAHMIPSQLELPVDKTWSAQENKQAKQSRRTYTLSFSLTHTHIKYFTQIGHIEAFTIIPHSL